MTKHERRGIDAIRTAIQQLNDRYTNPRRLEADLDTLNSALRKLPVSLTKIQKRALSQDLCDLLYIFAQADLISAAAVSRCQLLDELTEMADYDVADEDEFAETCEDILPLFREDIEALLTKLEDAKEAQSN